MNAKYHAYLIRFQRSESQVDWRTTLQNAQTGEVSHFANERELIRYLLGVLRETKPVDTGHSASTDSIP